MNKKKIEDITDIDELFKVWKDKQLKDSKNTGNTGFFERDGYIEKEKYRDSNKKILFLLKEANILAYKHNKNPSSIEEENQKDFYLEFGEEKYRFGNGLFVRAKDNRPKQKEKIARMARFLLEKSNNKKISSNYEDLKESLFQVAFMNINKMGGYERANYKLLHEYYMEYKEYILQEINILNPDIIIFMAKDEEIENDIKEFFKKKNKKIRIVKMLHTAAYGKNLNLDVKEEKFANEKFYKKYNLEYEGNGPFIVLNETTKRYLIKFVYRYKEGD